MNKHGDNQAVLLEARWIRKVYVHAGTELAVLKGIDLVLEQGEMVAIVGPSGAGKSTLLHILGGLDKPTAGVVRLAGVDIYGLNDRKRARVRNESMGFVFQFYHLLPEFSALENVVLPAMVKANDSNVKKFHARGQALLEQVGLGGRLSHKPAQLSGGEQQRVAIARALINEPMIIFCDEPTGNLNSETGREIIELLKGLNSKNKQAFVMVTHDADIAGICDRTITMRDGSLTV